MPLRFQSTLQVLVILTWCNQRHLAEVNGAVLIYGQNLSYFTNELTVL